MAMDAKRVVRHVALGVDEHMVDRAGGDLIDHLQQPISTSRCPSAGLRPVVSVSRMISRISRRISFRAPPPGRAGSRVLRARRLKRTVGVDDHMRPAPFFPIGKLPRDNPLEARQCHACAGQRPALLHSFRRADDENEVDRLVGAGFEQQRHVDDASRRALGRGAREEFPPRLPDERMDDPFEPLRAPRGRRARTPTAPPGRRRRPARRRGTRPRPPRRPRRVKRVHGRISVEQGQASARNRPAVVLFPMPIEPVSPSTTMIVAPARPRLEPMARPRVEGPVADGAPSGSRRIIRGPACASAHGTSVGAAP